MSDGRSALPQGWRELRLKFLASVQTGMAKGKDLAGTETVEVPYLRVANVQDGYLDLNEVATMAVPTADLERYRLQIGDVLMNEGGDFDKLGRGDVWHGQIDPCIHQNHVFAVRPHGVTPEWLNAYTGSAPAQFYFMGRSKQSTNLASISSSNLMELPVSVPPVAAQHQLLAYLDRETARIDALIEKKTRFIELLREKRQAVITRAVTRGLDVDLPMVPSDDDWLGAVPALWRLMRFQRLVDVAEGQVDPGVEPYRSMTLLAPNHIEPGTGRITYTETTEEQQAQSGKYLCAAGDVVYSKIRPALRKVCIAAETCLCSADMYPLRGKKGLRNAFLFWYLLSNEQDAICAYLDSVSGRIDRLIDRAEASISLLHECRAALITAVVTGQIDMRAELPAATLEPA